VAKNVPEALRRKVHQRARGYCEYCQASEGLTGQVFHVDHAIPRVRGGKTNMENLCLACPGCNGAKLDRILGFDPESGSSVTLFNPRQHQWNAHFLWNEEGVAIVGLSAIGRATIETLNLNRSLATAARRVWIAIRRHPPVDL